MSRGPRDESRSPAAARASFAEPGKKGPRDESRSPALDDSFDDDETRGMPPPDASSRARGEFKLRAIPKSPNLMRRHLHTKKLGGLRSRWTVMCGSRPCRYSTARAMSRQNSNVVRTPGRSLGTYCSSDPFSKSSSTNTSSSGPSFA